MINMLTSSPHFIFIAFSSFEIWIFHIIKWQTPFSFRQDNMNYKLKWKIESEFQWDPGSRLNSMKNDTLSMENYWENLIARSRSAFNFVWVCLMFTVIMRCASIAVYHGQLDKQPIHSIRRDKTFHFIGNSSTLISPKSPLIFLLVAYFDK